MYQVIGYAQIREFHAMLNALVPGDRWNGVDFFGSGEPETKTDPPYYQFRRNQDGVTLSLSKDDWGKLKAIYGTAMAEPTLQGNFAELSMIYGDL